MHLMTKGSGNLIRWMRGRRLLHRRLIVWSGSHLNFCVGALCYESCKVVRAASLPDLFGRQC